MNNHHLGWKHAGHYISPQNHLINDPTPRDQAVYIPSVTPSFAQIVYSQNWKRPLPSGVHPSDLNFLDHSNNLFRISHVMSSAGQALNQRRPCIITKRDRSRTMLICDSGGYQIASGKLTIQSTTDVLKILAWQEQHADVAMTLDVPTGPLLKPGYAFQSFSDCLSTTLNYLDVYVNNRSNPNVAFLNVLQGNTPAQLDTWYDAVKSYRFEGWAFAGPLRHNFYELCRRLLIMISEGQLQNKKWIHVLGTCELFVSVLLTALQRAINKYVNPDLRISYDTSSPFRILSYGAAYTLPLFDSNEMTMPTRRVPDDASFIGTKINWPWPSPLGDRMTMGDICVERQAGQRKYRDTQAVHYISHHNLAALCWGVALANRVFDADNMTHEHMIGHPAGAAAEAIEEIFKTQNFSNLQRYKTTFALLPHNQYAASDEEERDFLM
jgi:hypothetical protein